MLKSDNPGVNFQRHPHRENVIIWSRQAVGIKVVLSPPDQSLFAHLERQYGVGHIEYLGPIGRDGEDVYFCIKPDRSGGIYYHSHRDTYQRPVEYTGMLKDLRDRVLENERRKGGVGRRMENPKQKDALVVGDDYVVYEEFAEGTKGTSEENAHPPQEAYDDFWDSVYEAVGSLVRERDDAAYKLSRNLSDWYCEVSGFGWRGQSGYKIIDVSTYQKSDLAVGREFLRQILPNTDCTFYVYDDLDGAGLKIDNAHHDVPTGGEWYHAAPLAWMLMKGYWFGIQNDSDEIIESIHEAIIGEWEYEFLNVVLRDPKFGQRKPLDIEFNALCKQFLARYGKKMNDKHLDVLIGDLQTFFNSYYALDAMDEWADYLRNSDIEGVEQEISTFLGCNGVLKGDVDPADLDEMRRIYQKIEREG